MDISIIIVNWNACKLLQHCLSSIEANRGDLAIETIVVDSASSDDSVSMVEREFPQVRLIASRENLGYTRGNNVGVKEAKGRYLLILNPDTEIVSEALQQMVTYLDEHPSVGLVGPQLRYPNGSIQPSRHRFPQLTTALFQTPLGRRWLPQRSFKRAYFMADRPDDEIQPVDWLVGAALMIRWKTWQEVGPFDEQFFMYSDEIDWCYRCRKAGWEIHYLPQAQIIHHHKGSSGQIMATTRVRFYRSKILYYRKHFGVGWGIILHLLLVMSYAWLLAEAATKWAFDRRREARRQQMNDYWHALRSSFSKDFL